MGGARYTRDEREARSKPQLTTCALGRGRPVLPGTHLAGRTLRSLEPAWQRGAGGLTMRTLGPTRQVYSSSAVASSPGRASAGSAAAACSSGSDIPAEAGASMGWGASSATSCRSQAGTRTSRARWLTMPPSRGSAARGSARCPLPVPPPSCSKPSPSETHCNGSHYSVCTTLMQPCYADVWCGWGTASRVRCGLETHSLAPWAGRYAWHAASCHGVRVAACMLPSLTGHATAAQKLQHKCWPCGVGTLARKRMHGSITTKHQRL
jgi:hypothetical protein